VGGRLSALACGPVAGRRAANVGRRGRDAENRAKSTPLREGRGWMYALHSGNLGRVASLNGASARLGYVAHLGASAAVPKAGRRAVSPEF
jgi:hypothetical protein